MSDAHSFSNSPKVMPLRPPAGTIESWCFDLITTTNLATKLEPPPIPALSDEATWECDPVARPETRPGRPPELRVIARSGSTPRPAALVQANARGKLLHLFAHHELQAAELFAWALLAFPEAPREFRSGLARLCVEELAHMKLYRDHMRGIGTEYGSHPVRDWFWERMPACTEPAAFVSLQGLGLEGANLDHTVRFAAYFRAAGDEGGALILEQIERDETAHVAFAKKWFEHFTGAPLTFDAWRAKLPAPLTPSVLQSRPLNRSARMAAGLDAAFLDALAAAPPTNLRRAE